MPRKYPTPDPPRPPPPHPHDRSPADQPARSAPDGTHDGDTHPETTQQQITSNRCPSGVANGSLRQLHFPTSEGILTFTTPSQRAPKPRIWVRQHPTGLRSSVGGSGHDREAGPGTGVQAPPEAVLVAVAEVRDLLAAGSSGGDDRRSCGESAGRPEHDPADKDGSHGRRARRVGGVDPAPTRCPRKRSI